MIFDTLTHIDRYKTLHPAVYRALTVLRDTDFSAMAPCRVEIEGEALYYTVQSYETKSQNPTAEAHRRYVDIQLILEGSETMGAAPLEAMTAQVQAMPERDCWLYTGPMTYFTLQPGQFAIFFPEDAHAPGIAPTTPAPVRKCVAKVAL